MSSPTSCSSSSRAPPPPLGDRSLSFHRISSILDLEANTPRSGSSAVPEIRNAKDSFPKNCSGGFWNDPFQTLRSSKSKGSAQVGCEVDLGARGRKEDHRLATQMNKTHARVLVVDDDPSILSSLQTALSDAGISSVRAENGRKAIELLEDCAVELVVTDIVMPEGEGLETILALKRRYPAVKVVAMSGGGSADAELYLNLASRLGVSASLQKPFSAASFLQVVQSVLQA